MKFYISYFYKIRFFKPYQIPVSTAVWDPKWFHEFQDNSHIWKDKNGVWNGIRVEDLNPEKCHASGCPCSVRNPENCEFLKSYKIGLGYINFPVLIQTLELIGNKIKEIDNTQEEPEIVLIVYETPDNPCSERKALQELFERNGIELNELL